MPLVGLHVKIMFNVTTYEMGQHQVINHNINRITIMRAATKSGAFNVEALKPGSSWCFLVEDGDLMSTSRHSRSFLMIFLSPQTREGSSASGAASVHCSVGCVQTITTPRSTARTLSRSVTPK